ncbi:MAG: glucosamine-6-phosphate deaminase [Isosphaeraceae bacterium]|jgi:glucosamine-6-phosphate deaminase|nr:MAG: glucosamine-6-phosphate deaminase [Isosphaeraceae bacterium]
MPPEVATGLIAQWQVERLRVRVYESRQALGRAAAAAVAEAIRARQAEGRDARLVFAAAPSQNEFLAALVEPGRVDWSRVIAYHMDEYLGLDALHPASFRRYLCEHVFDPAGLAPERRFLIPGEQTDRPGRVCLEYEERLRVAPPDILCAGVGENGHLAFNDPPVADFADPLWVKVVRLDATCRRQQVNDGCFPRIEDVPTHAYTLTIPALLAAPVRSIVVPGPRKAAAVKTMLEGPIDERCPASILRTTSDSTLWLDRDSAAGLL